MNEDSAPLTLPPGTHVVTLAVSRGPDGERPAGAVGVVVKAPPDQQHAYRVRFPDGSEAAFRRRELAVRKALLREGFTETQDDDLLQYVIYRCVVGSRAYGLEHAGSDTDRRGIYLPPADRHWSLAGVPDQLENEATQETYWEIQRFLTFALKANPNALECLYTPLVETATPLAQELLSMRQIFLSRLLYQTYNGYVLSQFKKLEADLRNQGQAKWKHVMHLIRLLLAAITALREGEIVVRVSEHREALLAIRDGTLPWEEVNAWRMALHRELDLAYETTLLPERPDYERANAFLIRARRSMADAE